MVALLGKFGVRGRGRLVVSRFVAGVVLKGQGRPGQGKAGQAEPGHRDSQPARQTDRQTKNVCMYE
jgi:hypothetical protein